MSKMLVNVSVLNGTKDAEVIESIKSMLNSVDNTAFKVATKVAYLLNDSIPLNGGHIQRPKDREKLSLTKVAELIGRSKACVSAWVKAFRYVVENNLFDSFNNGEYPFSFDKINMIFSNKLVTEEVTFSDLMSMTVKDIEKLFKTEETEESEESEESEVVASGEMVTFEYGGHTFEVDKAILENFISTKCEMK